MFTQLKIVDSNGREVERGEHGEIWLRGALAFSGYWNNPQATAEMTCDGWTRTGDIGYIDADGDAFLCGRKKHMFISGGENVFPLEVERGIEAFPAVEEACVVGVPDGRWGEVGFAFVVPKSGMAIDIDELRAWLVGRLSTIKQPKHYAVVDAIPKNAAGKLNMKRMKDEATARLKRSL